MLRFLPAAVLCATLIARGHAADPADRAELITLHVSLTATADGQMQALLFEGKPIAEPADKRRTRFDELQSIVRKEIEAAPGSPGASRFEVVLEAPAHVKTGNVAKVLSAISSYRSETDGKTYPLIRNVRIRTAGTPAADNTLNLKLPKLREVSPTCPK